MNPGGHILIIDDEPSLRQTLARILQRAGFDATTAETAASGMTLLDQHTFDLVYLDIRMPDMSGLDALKLIHAKHPDLPVILFTAQPDLNSAVEALRRGATDYLLKPLSPQTVIDRTRAILEHNFKERRRREIQRQMDALQAELAALDSPAGESPAGSQEALAGSPRSDDRYLKFGRLTLDLHTRRVSMDDRSINLPPTSFDYLLSLARHAPNVVDYQTLVSEAQGYATDLREAQELTKWHVHAIRQALEPDPRKPVHVINVRGAGYRLVTS